MNKIVTPGLLPSCLNVELHGSSVNKSYNKKKKRYLMSYFPTGINRLYADFKSSTDRILGYRNLKSEFLKKVRYSLNLNPPRSYNEKIVWKKLYDRNPLLTITADKYAVRAYVKKMLGSQEAEKILIPLYHVTDDPETIPFDKLPEKFVVKPNHGSHMHRIILENKDKLEDEIKKNCRQWLKINYGLYCHEWAYRNIDKKIIVEKLIETDDCLLPLDFKFFCFDGKCKYFRISNNRLGSDGSLAFYDMDLNLLPVGMRGYQTAREPFKLPPSLKKMVQQSEKLSADFDAVRVDFYNCNGKVYFSELTHYHGSGLVGFEPESFDFELGSHWNIKTRS